VSVPPQQKPQLKEGRILREHIDIGNSPVHCQATTTLTEKPYLSHPNILIQANSQNRGMGWRKSNLGFDAKWRGSHKTLEGLVADCHNPLVIWKDRLCFLTRNLASMTKREGQQTKIH
jgi:hypothetical protein